VRPAIPHHLVFADSWVHAVVTPTCRISEILYLSPGLDTRTRAIRSEATGHWAASGGHIRVPLTELLISFITCDNTFHESHEMVYVQIKT
jgi:hypothetical protein